MSSLITLLYMAIWSVVMFVVFAIMPNTLSGEAKMSNALSVIFFSITGSVVILILRLFHIF